MTEELKSEIILQINEYADKVLKNIDKEKTPISIQLDSLKPEMKRLSQQHNLEIDDIFITYLDAAANCVTERPRNIDNIEGYIEDDTDIF
jgi:hypothetical protein